MAMIAEGQTIRMSIDVELTPEGREFFQSFEVYDAKEVSGAVGRGPAAPLAFDDVTRINLQRCRRWHAGFGVGDDWNGADWSNAMQGEAGEAGNVVKKLRRLDTGMTRRGAKTELELKADLAAEIADTFLYLDLLASYYDIDLPLAVATKFNQVSEEEGFPERITV